MSVMPPKSVLLVEDDELLRECLCEMLGEAGWQVAGAASATEALAQMEQDGTPDVLVTDLSLGPEMSGLGLIAAARRQWSHFRAVLMSGADMSELTLNRGDRFLGKPFRMDALIQAVTEAAAQLAPSDCRTAAGP